MRKMIEIDCYHDCDFTFEDEVNTSHKINSEIIVMHSESNHSLKFIN